LNTDTIVGVFNGITKKCKLSSINLDLLSDGTNYKRISATKATKINGGTFSEDDLADGTSYKRVQAAKADALNSSTIVAGTIWSSGNDGNGGQPPAPKPKAYSSRAIGEFYKISSTNTALYAPAGGKWAYFGIMYNTSTMVLAGTDVGVIAGGGAILSATTGQEAIAMVWRVE